MVDLQMTEDPCKRFQAIMDKLYVAPKPVSRSPRGMKRPHMESPSTLVELGTGGNMRSYHLQDVPETHLCRPWSRDDLFRRAATFKSMKWFAKPKVVNAVNCARRGWRNIDVDIIACEACGARLQFSTPTTWSYSQVAKASLVFSLKLDNGHKSLCPWIDNVCDESLAEFPPSSPSVLVDTFKGRLSYLSQLTALPIISSSAIAYLRCPPYEKVTKQPLLQYNNDSSDICRKIFPRKEQEANSTSLYCQALNVISICGWDPRLLSCAVDGREGKIQLAKNAHILDPYQMGGSCLAQETKETYNGSEHLCRTHADPDSVVLDCGLCGASVGLWVFNTVPQPLELFRLVGYTELQGQTNYGGERRNENAAASSSNALFSFAGNQSPDFTIAGGPPPEKQNFKARISLPIIGRNLMGQLSCGLGNQVKDNNLGEQLIESNVGACESNGNGALLDLDESMGQFRAAPNMEVTDSTAPCFDRHQGNVPYASAPDANANGGRHVEDIAVGAESKEREMCLVDQKKMNCQASNVEEDTRSSMEDQAAILNENVQKAVKVGGVKELSSDKAMEFDPFKHHRQFCPWIASAGCGAPGWHQTMSALLQKQSSACSPSTIMVDDPIAVVKKMFGIDPTKRLQPSSVTNKRIRHG